MNGQPCSERGSMFWLESVYKAYPDVVALEPIDLRIEHGERVALMGPSGSGKSTLLQLLAGVLAPTGGKLWIDGIATDSLPSGPTRSKLVGIMPQSLDLIPSLAVVHNVNAGRLGHWSLLRALWSLISPQEVNEVLNALERVGIPDKLYERTAHLSGGQQQRVALARLLIQQPRAILADEPVASVDPARAEALIGLLVDLVREQGQTLVASLHSVPLALAHFSRIVALRGGEVVFDRPAGRVTDEDLASLYALETVYDRVG